MTVLFFAETETHTDLGALFQPMQEEDMAEMPPPQMAGDWTYDRPKYDRAGVTGSQHVELRAGKWLVRAEGIDTVPADAQGIGGASKDTIIDLQMANNIATYFSLTQQNRDAMIGKPFARAIYGLLLVKPPLVDGERKFWMGRKLFWGEVG